MDAALDMARAFAVLSLLLGVAGVMVPRLRAELHVAAAAVMAAVAVLDALAEIRELAVGAAALGATWAGSAAVAIRDRLRRPPDS